MGKQILRQLFKTIGRIIIIQNRGVVKLRFETYVLCWESVNFPVRHCFQYHHQCWVLIQLL